jgi:hypothetical protein
MILKWENYNSKGLSYTSYDVIVFDDKKHLDEILELSENKGFSHRNRFEDDSMKQHNFDEAGGFSSELLSACDINGNDISDLVEDWFGRPREI